MCRLAAAGVSKQSESETSADTHVKDWRKSVAKAEKPEEFEYVDVEMEDAAGKVGPEEFTKKTPERVQVMQNVESAQEVEQITKRVLSVERNTGEITEVDASAEKITEAPPNVEEIAEAVPEQAPNIERNAERAPSVVENTETTIPPSPNVDGGEQPRSVLAHVGGKIGGSAFLLDGGEQPRSVLAHVGGKIGGSAFLLDGVMWPVVDLQLNHSGVCPKRTWEIRCVEARRGCGPLSDTPMATTERHAGGYHVIVGRQHRALAGRGCLAHVGRGRGASAGQGQVINFSPRVRQGPCIIDVVERIIRLLIFLMIALGGDGVKEEWRNVELRSLNVEDFGGPSRKKSAAARLHRGASAEKMREGSKQENEETRQIPGKGLQGGRVANGDIHKERKKKEDLPRAIVQIISDQCYYTYAAMQASLKASLNVGCRPNWDVPSFLLAARRACPSLVPAPPSSQPSHIALTILGHCCRLKRHDRAADPKTPRTSSLGGLLQRDLRLCPRIPLQINLGWILKAQSAGSGTSSGRTLSSSAHVILQSFNPSDDPPAPRVSNSYNNDNIALHRNMMKDIGGDSTGEGGRTHIPCGKNAHLLVIICTRPGWRGCARHAVHVLHKGGTQWTCLAGMHTQVAMQRCVHAAFMHNSGGHEQAWARAVPGSAHIRERRRRPALSTRGRERCWEVCAYRAATCAFEAAIRMWWRPSADTGKTEEGVGAHTCGGGSEACTGLHSSSLQAWHDMVVAAAAIRVAVMSTAGIRREVVPVVCAKGEVKG
ncbi:hypothetical protein GGX14DRAFT_384648 [Mycena pura]|uniref:Uncharacterized protein n=1 Tax=Mycena pura TaxID=153505 RepID=A0AAD7E676_9AGAR|nr:hypothetical protein GGX14DRAFT_384648 [Mycena pura]